MLVVDAAVGVGDAHVAGVEIDHDSVLFVLVEGAGFGGGLVGGHDDLDVFVFDGRGSGLGEREGGQREEAEGKSHGG